MEERYHTDFPQGQVYAQQPLPEEPYDEGTAIHLIVSLGPETVWVPSELYNMTSDEAEVLLDELGIPYKLNNVYDDSAHPGTVMYSNPAVGEQVIIDSDNPLQVYIALPTEAEGATAPAE